MPDESGDPSRSRRRDRGRRLFYGSRDPDLSLRFRTEVFAAIERARTQPLLFRQFEPGLRKVKTDCFPYFIIFKFDPPENLQILAVAHASRRPGYWKHRSANP